MSNAFSKYGLIDATAPLLPPKPLPLPPRAIEYLEDLMARPSGISAIEYPGQRLAHGIYLMRKLGVEVETQQERHEGAHAGIHARYRLKSWIVRLTPDGSASARLKRPQGAIQAVSP